LNSPLVSVVIPTYSRPTFLKRCVESVLNQSYSNREIFVVDDNNPETDERLETEKVMAYFTGNARVTYLQHDKNKNGSAARNTGWRQSSGKYITFLDDDDEIEPTKIEKQVECLENLDDSWGSCYTGYRIIKDSGEQVVSSETRSGDCYLYALMRTMFMGSGSNLFIRKAIVDTIDGYDESFKRNQDIEFLARVLENHKIAYIDEVLLTIHQEGSRTVRSFEQIDSYSQHFLDKFSDRINALPENDKKKVIGVISLERCRIAFRKRHYKDGIRILKENKVGIGIIIKYIYYLGYRKITKKSYGFSG
jgi:glycosyltransferase involved in cell wall biosynthesis